MSDAVTRVERWPRAGMRLIRTASGWIHLHLAATGTGFLTQFDEDGRFVRTAHVWWDEARRSDLLDSDLESGLVALGLGEDDAPALTREVIADLEPLQAPSPRRTDALRVFAPFLAGWVLALALLAWIVATQVL